MSEDEIIENCYFCDETEHLDYAMQEVDDGFDHQIICDTCGACGPLKHTPEEARIAWNTRWFEAHAVDVLAIRLAYIAEKPLLFEENINTHKVFEQMWKVKTVKSWEDMRTRFRDAAKKLLRLK